MASHQTTESRCSPSAHHSHTVPAQFTPAPLPRSAPRQPTPLLYSGISVRLSPLLVSLFCCPEMLTVSAWAFQGDRANIIQWGLLHSSRKRPEFQLGPGPLLRTWIMLSVHRHYRSWNDKANELSAGRWVQDLLSLNQLTLETPFRCAFVCVCVTGS